MKKTAFILLLLLSIAETKSQSIDSTIVVKSDYWVTMEYPNLAVSFFAWITGAEPEKLRLEETFITTNSGAKEISMMLIADNNEIWLRVFFGIAGYSFVKFPKSEKIDLTPDGLRFINKFKEFLRDSSSEFLKDDFEFGEEKLTAIVKKIGIRRFSVTTLNEKGEIYIDGEITVDDYQNQAVYPEINVYPEISVNLRADKIKIKISLENATIFKK